MSSSVTLRCKLFTVILVPSKGLKTGCKEKTGSSLESIWQTRMWKYRTLEKRRKDETMKFSKTQLSELNCHCFKRSFSSFRILFNLLKTTKFYPETWTNMSPNYSRFSNLLYIKFCILSWEDRTRFFLFVWIGGSCNHSIQHLVFLTHPPQLVQVL